MAALLPRLFFIHFRDTSFVVEDAGRIVAFLVGFVSQSQPGQAYIHVVGVDPNRRREGLARGLYERFFAAVRARGCREVHLVTAPVNRESVAFHGRLGFVPQPGDAHADGVPVTADYDGRGHARVRFVRSLA